MILGLAGFTLALLGGIFLGFVAALRRGSWLDRGVIVLASSGLAIPSFFLALVLAYLFGNVFGILPTQGMHSLDSEDSLSDLLRHLPAIALAVGPIAVVARMTRSSTLEVLGQDYVRTARGKGLTEQVILAAPAQKHPHSNRSSAGPAGRHPLERNGAVRSGILVARRRGIDGPVDPDPRPGRATFTTRRSSSRPAPASSARTTRSACPHSVSTSCS